MFSCIAFVQHDQIKEAIAKGNSFFELLIRCAMEEKFHYGLVLQLSLEILWILTFNQTTREILRTKYQVFLEFIKTSLIHSDREEIRVAAKGILWKLENESIFKKKILNEHLDSSTYDLMISYSHSNKELCHQIHQRLLQSNYRVWIDLQNMYGSTFQSMAQGIEASEIILICMSNPYKQSAYCQSEAEYAYTRRRHMIPVLVEKNYRPDGWLGLICGSKLRVDFTKGEFGQVFQMLIAQIQLHHRQESTNGTTPLSHETTVKVNNPSLGRIRLESERLITDNDRLFQNWTHEDLLKFLREKQLDIFRPLFENEELFDGQALVLLYEQCQSNMESTYGLLNSQLTQFHHQTLPYTTFIRFVTELTKLSSHN